MTSGSFVPIANNFQDDLKTGRNPPKKRWFFKMPTPNFKKRPAGAIHDLRFGEPLSQVCGPPKTLIHTGPGANAPF